MNKVAIVVLADTETLGELGRIVNALEAVKEFKDAGDDVRLIFDGAGTKWIGALAGTDHHYADLFAAVKDTVSGACAYCADAFQVSEAVRESGVGFLGEYDDHPSFRKLVSEGYQVITF